MKNLRAILLVTGTAIIAALAVGTAFAATTVAF